MAKDINKQWRYVEKYTVKFNVSVNWLSNSFLRKLILETISTRIIYNRDYNDLNIHQLDFLNKLCTENIVDYCGAIDKDGGMLHLLTQIGVPNIMLSKSANGRTV